MMKPAFPVTKRCFEMRKNPLQELKSLDTNFSVLKHFSDQEEFLGGGPIRFWRRSCLIFVVVTIGRKFQSCVAAK